MAATGRIMEAFLTASDGTRLFYRRWQADSPARAVCLLVHGLAEHSGRYSRLAEYLAGRRFSVWAPDHRGHGRSEGRRGDCRSFDSFVEDLRRLAGEAAREEPALARLMVGHSLGGLIALAFAARHPQEIRAVAVSSPALRLAHPTDPVTAFVVTNIAKLLPTVPFRNGVNPRVLSHDPEVAAEYVRDPLVHRVLTARCAVALRDAMRDSPRLAAQLKIPCLILQAGADEICAPQAAEEFARSCSNGLVTFRRYDRLYHEIFNEVEKERVMEDLCQWLESRL